MSATDIRERRWSFRVSDVPLLSFRAGRLAHAQCPQTNITYRLLFTGDEARKRSVPGCYGICGVVVRHLLRSGGTGGHGVERALSDGRINIGGRRTFY